MNFSPRTPHPRSETCNSFRRTLLRRPLHKFGALAPVTPSDGISYGGNVQKTRKSFRRLLLSLFVPVSPLGAHSYKKMGCCGIKTNLEDRSFKRNPTRPYVTPLDSYSSRPRAARPCLSPLESHSYKKWWGGCQYIQTGLICQRAEGCGRKAKWPVKKQASDPRSGIQSGFLSLYC
jgi:hypothetical protein